MRQKRRMGEESEKERVLLVVGGGGFGPKLKGSIS